MCLAGTATYQVHGGKTFTLRPGSAAYFSTGTSVTMDMSDGFVDVVCLMGEAPVSW